MMTRILRRALFRGYQPWTLNCSTWGAIISFFGKITPFFCLGFALGEVSWNSYQGNIFLTDWTILFAVLPSQNLGILAWATLPERIASTWFSSFSGLLSWLVPWLIVIGLSVLDRIVRQGIPRWRSGSGRRNFHEVGPGGCDEVDMKFTAVHWVNWVIWVTCPG
jgi:hypothetical protein